MEINTYEELLKEPVIKNTIASKADVSGMRARLLLLTDLRSMKSRFEVEGKESNGALFCCIYDDLIISCNFYDKIN